jgi:hypothetical protein
MFCWNLSTLFRNTFIGIFLPLQKYYTLSTFQNSVLRKVFGHKREEVIGHRRRLHNEELHSLYSSPNIVQVAQEGLVGQGM